jgi:hypothetical protein
VSVISRLESVIGVPVLSIAALRPRLESLGYKPSLLREKYAFGASTVTRTTPLVAFAHEPADLRSACIAAIDASEIDDSRISDEIATYRDLGAPLVFALRRGHLELWVQTPQAPQLRETLTSREVDSFFERERGQLSPDAIYRAKTLGRFQPDAQLDFVDVGLLPVVEGQLGRRLSALIEELVDGVRKRLGDQMAESRGQWMLREVFWLIAAKTLHDKAVPNFKQLHVDDVDKARDRVALHYGEQAAPPLSPRERAALAPVGQRLAQFASLAQVTTEALAFVYESALVSAETRKLLGTHSTPTMLVDYVVGRLASQLEAIAIDERRVFEPACGHAPFLVAAMRALRDGLPHDFSDDDRKRYLRQRLAGIEIDSGAVEIARLSLTLADIPHPNGWNLQPDDLFKGDRLEKEAARATVLLANPPYEDFSADERAQYEKDGVQLRTKNKAFELLSRALPKLPEGALVGLVLQRSFLQSKQAAAIRRELVEKFQLLEITLLPEKLFEIAHHETVVVLARRGAPPKGHELTYRRVRERDRDRFRETAQPTTTRQVSQSRFTANDGWDLRVPDYEELWLPYLPRASSIAEIGQGFSSTPESRIPAGVIARSDKPFPGSSPGFLRFPVGGLLVHRLPEEYHFSLRDDVISVKRRGTTVGVPQVLLPHAPAGLGPWRVTAHIDRLGHAVKNNFLVVRPAARGVTLEYLWALFVSPYANAYAYAQLGKRHNLDGVLMQMPVPNTDKGDIDRVTTLVRTYFELANKRGTLDDALREAILRVDAEVLRLYGLPAKLERALLRLFDGVERPGVPFSFDRYYPPDFESAIPLHIYLSDAYRRATPARLLSASKAPKELVTALKRATEEFGDD